MYGILTYIYLNVGKYTISDGFYGICLFEFNGDELLSLWGSFSAPSQFKGSQPTRISWDIRKFFVAQL